MWEYMTVLFSLLFCSIVLASSGAKLQSYNLNKYSTTEFNLDCVHTTRSNIPTGHVFTFCYRHKPVVTLGQMSGYVFIGNLGEGWQVDSGFDFTIWPSGPWLGLRSNGRTVWVGLGKGEGFDLLAWRHTCLSINFLDGKYNLYENGKLQVGGTADEFVEFKDKMPLNVNMVSIGCAYGAYKDSHIGVVTDFQLFGRALSTQDMEAWTECLERNDGDVISWEAENWHFNKTDGSSEVEHLDHDMVCNMVDQSLHIFPIKTLFRKALHLCEKISGKLVQ